MNSSEKSTSLIIKNIWWSHHDEWFFIFFCFCLFQMILAQRSVILLFLFLFLFSPTHSYQIWDWKERQKRRLERQSKRLALSGPVIANEVIDDQVINYLIALRVSFEKNYLPSTYPLSWSITVLFTSRAKAFTYIFTTISLSSHYHDFSCQKIIIQTNGYYHLTWIVSNSLCSRKYCKRIC